MCRDYCCVCSPFQNLRHLGFRSTRLCLICSTHSFNVVDRIFRLGHLSRKTARHLVLEIIHDFFSTLVTISLFCTKLKLQSSVISSSFGSISPQVLAISTSLLFILVMAVTKQYSSSRSVLIIVIGCLLLHDLICRKRLPEDRGPKNYTTHDLSIDVLSPSSNFFLILAPIAPFLSLCLNINRPIFLS